MSRKSKMSEYLNDRDYGNWFTRLYNIALASIEWTDVPESIDQRYLEQTLFWRNMCVWFEDEILGELVLPVINTSLFDWYGNLVTCRGRSYNYTSRLLQVSPWSIDGKLVDQDAVVIYGNVGRTPDLDIIVSYARRLSEIDRVIDINVKAQKTPVLVRCEESERLTMKNVYSEFEGNEPVIFGSKNINPNFISSVDTKAPYVGSDLYMLRKQILGDCLAYLGIESNVSEKSERVLSGEITANMGQIEIYRQTRLFPRLQAAKKINKIFGHNIDVHFRSELDLSKIMEGGAPNDLSTIYKSRQNSQVQ